MYEMALTSLIKVSVVITHWVLAYRRADLRRLYLRVCVIGCPGVRATTSNQH